MNIEVLLIANLEDINTESVNNYQVNTDRQIADLKKQIEINNTSINKSLEQIHKGLPGKIRGVIGHIEFSQNNLR